jgi:hypothetical protein
VKPHGCATGWPSPGGVADGRGRALGSSVLRAADWDRALWAGTASIRPAKGTGSTLAHRSCRKHINTKTPIHQHLSR